MLDGGAAGLCLGLLDPCDTVQAGPNCDSLPDSQQQPQAVIGNDPPTIVAIETTSTIDEGNFASLRLTFDDTDNDDPFTVEIDWGDGTFSDVVNMPTGERTLDATHLYLDDYAVGTTSDTYTVRVRVTDKYGDSSDEATSTVTVNNVAPTTFVSSPTPIFENGSVQLLVSINDPGPLDSHAVEIDWGDGSPLQVEAVSGGMSFMTTVHQYLDDNPTGTPLDDYKITVRVYDDDGGVAPPKQVTATVVNFAPTQVQVDPLAPVDENGFAVVTGKFFEVGTQDTHQLEVDWGDGSAPELVDIAPGARTFSATHQYLDDNPTGTASDMYAVSVRVFDDDGGISNLSVGTVVVNNVAPTGFLIPPTTIAENGVATMTVEFSDVGTLDTHQVEVNWGDGSAVQLFAVPTGQNSLTVMHQYLDDSHTGAQDTYTLTVRVIDDDNGFSAPLVASLEVENFAPSNLQLGPLTTDPLAAINENDVATLTGSFDDPGSLDVHTVEVDWGDGSPIEFVTLAAGERTFAIEHRYLDDNPTGTPEDNYTIKARVRDDDGDASDEATASITVRNLAPDAFVAPPTAIFENGIATLFVSFGDPGTLDSHNVEIDWGDGSPLQTATVSAGLQFVTVLHQYLDDNPTGTPVDNYTITVRVSDDDGGVAAPQQVSATVVNLAPTNVMLAPPATIDENGVAVLNGTFEDAGSQDVHRVEIDWGDGSAVQFVDVTPGARNFTASHQYLDDNPTFTSSDQYPILVRVLDDDGGASVRTPTAVTVNNVAPTAFLIPPPTIGENGIATVTVVFTDPGTLDTHTVQIDWGDGSGTELLPVPTGQSSLTMLHQYLDDSPSGTSQDSFTLTVRVRDDDSGISAPLQAVLMVQNIAPSNLQLAPMAPIDENGSATLSGTFEDPGSLDTHTVEVDWGDGTAVQIVPLTPGDRSFTLGHPYLDDNPTGTPQDNYAIKVRVRDDDGAFAEATASVTVRNVAPNIFVVPPPAIFENGIASLLVAFDDPGTQDTHQVEVDWGDGSTVQLVPVSFGARSITVTHQYLDDNPTGTPQDNFTIKVRVRDDDGGASAQVLTTINVRNISPTNVVVTPSESRITEGAPLALGISFDDPGTLDTHAFVINWGDGLTSSGSMVGNSFNATHIYADNGNYTVNVTISDDDGGMTVGTAKVMVTNVAPTLQVASNQTVNEGALLSITNIGVIVDPGFDNPLNTGDPANGGETQETFTYVIDWGDRTAPQVGIAPIDQHGGPGLPTIASIDGLHVYADNGTYTVQVTVVDDDFGQVLGRFTVTVLNVDPTLTGVATSPTVNEGQAFTLSSLGVGLQDPGFDNPNNVVDPSNGGEVAETFTGVDVDWGDGTSADALGIVNRVSGSPGHATTADFSHASHIYADNGSYTVTVRFQDDDGPVVARTFTVIVNNVAPTLTLTSQQFTLDEGQTLSIANLGSFTDPGFDNPARGTTETFHYTINWGDGTVETLQPVATRTNGGPGVATTGALTDSHRYLDNDADNRYTITVTLFDDDGGFSVRSFDVTVFNVNPTLQPISATDVDALGQTTLQLAFSDPGADSFQVLVDWGDGKFLVERTYAGPTPQSFTIGHMYTTPPDPSNPAADITIRVKIRDDDFGTPGVVAVGESNLESTVITNPGEGNKFIRIDTSPKVPMLSFPVRPVSTVVVANPQIAVDTDNDEELVGAAGESKATSERYLELDVINPDGTIAGVYRLPPEALANLPALFRHLPDGHYAVYLVQTDTLVKRLVIEVFVRDGRLIDPSDDTEGARDKPPSDEATSDANKAAIEAAIDGVDEGPNNPGAAAPTTDAPSSDAAATPTDADGAQCVPEFPVTNPLVSRSVAAMRHGSTLASVALALSAAGRSWRAQVDETLAKAKSQERKQLKSVGHWRGKKPR